MFTAITLAALATGTVVLDQGALIPPGHRRVPKAAAILGAYTTDTTFAIASAGDRFFEGTITGQAILDFYTLELRDIEVTVPIEIHEQDTFQAWTGRAWEEFTITLDLDQDVHLSVQDYANTFEPRSMDSSYVFPIDGVNPTVTGESIFYDWKLEGPLSSISGRFEYPFGYVSPIQGTNTWYYQITPNLDPKYIDLIGQSIAVRARPNAVVWDGRLDGAKIQLQAYANSFIYIAPEPSGTVLVLPAIGLLVMIRRRVC